MPNKIVAALLFFSAVTLCAAPVNLLFFHSECRECEIVQIYLQELSANFEEVSIHDYPLEDEANFSHLLKLESALNLENSKNAPVSVFLYTNAFYGLTEITNALPVRVMASLKTGAAIFDPNLDNSAEDLAKKRLARFTLTSVLITRRHQSLRFCHPHSFYFAAFCLRLFPQRNVSNRASFYASDFPNLFGTWSGPFQRH